MAGVVDMGSEQRLDDGGGAVVTEAAGNVIITFALVMFAPTGTSPVRVEAGPPGHGDGGPVRRVLDRVVVDAFDHDQTPTVQADGGWEMPVAWVMAASIRVGARRR
jgi:hypothetical protein